MFESILHFIGVCPDSLSHPNLINLIASGTVASGVLFIIRNKIKSFFNWFKKTDKGDSYEKYLLSELERTQQPEYLKEQQRIENERIYMDYEMGRIQAEIKKRLDKNKFIYECISKTDRYMITNETLENMSGEYQNYLNNRAKLEKIYDIKLSHYAYCFYILYKDKLMLDMLCSLFIYPSNYCSKAWMVYDKETLITDKELSDKFEKEYLK